jgi:HSP20 family protein
MSLVPWDPFRGFENYGKELSKIFDFSPSGFWGGMSGPNVDVYQTADEVIVKAEIPGAVKEDLDLYIDENLIRISGQTKRDKEYRNEDMYRTERYYGSFSRTIPLPCAVKSEQAKAEYKDGILSVIAPKCEQAKLNGRKIDID